MKILLFYQNNNRSIFFESLLKELQNVGHSVAGLTLIEKGAFHDGMEKIGIESDSLNVDNNWSMRKRLLVGAKRFRKYCRREEIQVVYSHLQQANLVALIGRKFSQIQAFPCRHHVDVVALGKNINAKRLDRLVNRMSEKLIVVSNVAKEYIVEREGQNSDSVFAIPLGYDFALYGESLNADGLRLKYSHDIILVMIARHIPTKNHQLVIRAIAELTESGLDVGLILLDQGPLLASNKQLAVQLGIQHKVHFEGHKSNIADYFAIADLVVLPTISESSNQVVKEAGLYGKTVLTCANVGDFEEYLNPSNSYLVRSETVLRDFSSTLKKCLQNPNFKIDSEKKASELRKTVIEKFDIKKVAQQYLSLTLK